MKKKVKPEVIIILTEDESGEVDMGVQIKKDPTDARSPVYTAAKDIVLAAQKILADRKRMN